MDMMSISLHLKMLDKVGIILAKLQSMVSATFLSLCM